MVKKQLKCKKCGSNKIIITWKYGLQYEDSVMKCAECKSRRLEVS